MKYSEIFTDEKINKAVSDKLISRDAAFSLKVVMRKNILNLKNKTFENIKDKEFKNEEEVFKEFNEELGIYIDNTQYKNYTIEEIILILLSGWLNQPLS